MSQMCKARHRIIGQGEQRVKFQDESHKWTTKRDADHKCRQVARSNQPGIVRPSPSRRLSNKNTSLISAFIGRIEEIVEIRVQLLWNFGVYMREVPRRLGTSAALDAASDALVVSHREFCMARRFGSNHQVLYKHTCALAILRNQLGDTVKARLSETLCCMHHGAVITQVCPFPLDWNQNQVSANSLWIQLPAPR